MLSESLEVPIVVGAFSKIECRRGSCLEDCSSQSNLGHINLEYGTANRLQRLTYGGDENPNHQAHAPSHGRLCALVVRVSITTISESQ